MSTTPYNFEPLLDSKEAAALLGIHEKSAIRLAREKKLPAVRIGRLWRFRASQLDAWLQGQATQICQPK